MKRQRPFFQEQFVTLADGLRLAYVEHGDADGTPVVMLHGVTDSWRSFEPMLPHLSGDLRAIAVTLRGHGHSSRPERGYTYSDMATDVVAFMDALALPQAIIVGHSMGSMVAQRLAADHPERVSALVLMGAFATLFRHSELSTFVAEAIAPLRDPIDAEFARSFQLSTLAQNIDSRWVDGFVNESLKVPARIWRALFDSFLSTPDFSAALRRVVAPVLIAWGDRDIYTLRADQDKLLASFTDARLLVYEGAGHAFHWEEPARFAQDLTAFAREVSPLPLAVPSGPRA